METRVLRSAVFLSLFTILTITHIHAAAPTGQIGKAVELRLKKERSSSLASGQRIYAYDPSWMRRFYERRSFQPAWVSGGGLRPEVRDLAAALRKAELEGLNSSDCSLCAIESAAEYFDHPGTMDEAMVGRVDVLLTDSFLHYASDLYSGRIDPRAVNEEWDIHPRTCDLARVLRQALDSTGIGPSLARLSPSRSEYVNLKKALAFYRSLPAIPDPAKITGVRHLAKGDSSRMVSVLRKRVATWYPGIEGENAVFDSCLQEAVITFQSQNGIEPDGVVGRETIAALNRTREDCLQQVVANLERCRWLADETGDRHIVVNIPGFELQVMENRTAIKSMRVVVGRSDHRTPLLSNAMTYLVFSPFWNVPQAIAAKEIVPQIIKNVSYLKKEKLKVFEQEGDDLSELDPDSVDWSGVQGRNLRFRMDPGAKNSLGRIKFMFPNCNNVYLHDTPAKSLFNKSARQLSHGCVRVEEPVQLAAYLLAKDTAWVKAEIRKASSRHGERVVRLPEPVPVHLEYFTAWVDASGTLQFRNDIYGWDDQVLKAMHGIPVLKKKPGVKHFASRVTQEGPSVQ